MPSKQTTERRSGGREQGRRWGAGKKQRCRPLHLELLESRFVLDSIGAAVLNHFPLAIAPDSGPLNIITITFNEAIDVSSFDEKDIVLKDPQGVPIGPVLVSPVANSGDTRFQLTFSDQVLRGSYRLTVGPEVADVADNPLNQDGDGTNGEREDAFTGEITFNPRTRALSGVARELFFDGFESWTPAPSHWAFVSGSEGTVSLTEANGPLSGLQHLHFRQLSRDSLSQSAVLALDLSDAPQGSILLEFSTKNDGHYLYSESHVELSADGQTWHDMLTSDFSSNYATEMLNLSDHARRSGLGTDDQLFVRFRQFTRAFDSYDFYIDNIRIFASGLQVIEHVPSELENSSDPLNSMTVTFNKPINPKSFDATDIVLKSPQGFPITPVSLTDVAGSNDTQFQLAFADQNLRGDYRLTIGPGITDPIGNPMNQDGDANTGELADSYRGTTTFASESVVIPSGAGNLFSENFEGWNPPPTFWSFTTVSDGTISAITSESPYTGSHHLNFDTTNSGFPALSATLKLDLSGQEGATDLFLSYFVKNKVPAGQSGGDRLWLSGDGQGFHRIFLNEARGEYANFVFDLDQLAWEREVALDDDVFIRFGHVAGSGWNLFLDDVQVVRGDLAGPRVLDQTPTEISGSDGPFNSVTVTFNEAITPEAFESSDFILKDPLGGIVESASITPVAGTGNTQFQISFPDQDVRGTYRFRIGPLITDVAGNLMNQDGDPVIGDAYAAEVTFESEPLVLFSDTPILFQETFEGWTGPHSYWSFLPLRFAADVPAFEVVDGAAHSGSHHLRSNARNGPGEPDQVVVLEVDLSNQLGRDDLFFEFWARGGVRGVLVSQPGKGGRSVLTPHITAQYERFVVDLDQQAASISLDLAEPLMITLILANSEIFIDDVRITQGQPALDLEIEAARILENAGGGAATATVSRRNTLDFGQDLVVALVSDDETEATIPPTVTIPAGSSFVRFDLNAVDDNLLDGAQPVTITATADGFSAVSNSLEVLDFEALNIEFDPVSVVEDGGLAAAIATLRRGNLDDLGSPLAVTITSNDLSEAIAGGQNPFVVTIPAGADTMTFPVDAVDDADLDGPQDVGFTAVASNFIDGLAALTVTDSEPATLLTSLTSTLLSETDVSETATVTLRRNRDVAAVLVATLVASDVGELSFPRTVVFPSGKTEITFTVAAVNDPFIDGAQTVALTATADSYIDGQVTISVADDDTPARRTLGGRFTETVPAGVYDVLQDWGVPAANELVIEPGAVFRFESAVGMHVSGSLSAIGTPTSPITFTSAANDPAPGDWAGITANGTRQNVLFQHVNVDSAASGIIVGFSAFPNSEIIIIDSNLFDNLNNGVSVAGKQGGTRNVEIKNNRIFNNGENGVYVRASSSGGPKTGSSARAGLYGNEIFANGDAGVRVASRYGLGAGFANGAAATVTVDGNSIHANQQGGVVGSVFESVGAFGSAVMIATITNNLVQENLGPGVELTRRGDGFLGAITANNTIVLNSGPGIHQIGANTAIRNNIVVENTGGIQTTGADRPDPGKVAHNLLFANLEGPFIGYPPEYGVASDKSRRGTPSDQQQNIFADPLFLAPDDFHLRPTSPAIDAGTDLGAPSRDFDGQERGTATSFSNISVDFGFEPLDIGFDEAEEKSGVELLGQDALYEQDFDVALGADVAIGATHLPPGWFVEVGGRTGSITAEQFPPSSTLPGPYNAGERRRSDRSLAIGDTGAGSSMSLVFETTVVEQDLRAVRLEFDVEAWAADPLIADNPGEAALTATLQVLQGSEFVDVVEFGTASTSEQLELPDHTNGDATFFRANAVSTLSSGPLLEDFSGDDLPDILSVATRSVRVMLNRGDGTFGEALRTPLPETPKSLPTTTDLDDDGITDIITIHREANQEFLSILLGNGDGTFSQAAVYETASGALLPSIGDMNNDGTLDIVVVSASRVGASASVLLGVGDGTFNEVAPVALDLRLVFSTSGSVVTPVSQLLTDINGDKLPDFVISDEGSIHILVNQGGRRLVASARHHGLEPESISSGDWDNDGDVDLAISNSLSVRSATALFFNDGSGEFGAPTEVAIRGDELKVADLNGDGYQDLLGICTCSSTLLQVALNNGDGLFADATLYVPGSDLALADLDNDDDIDVVVVGTAQDANILLNRGDGSFDLWRYETPQDSDVSRVALANFDGDNDVDLALTDGRRLAVFVVPNIRTVVNGNDATNRMSFDSGLIGVNVPVGSTVRLRFDVPEEARTEGWVVGLDNVAIETNDEFLVKSLTPTSTGFVVEFNNDVDPSELNLFHSQGSADIVFSGQTTGQVMGSLVVDESLRKIAFVKTGGPLEVDTYTVTLRSAADGFESLEGKTLDGNRDGTEGDDFVTSFTVGTRAAEAVTVSVPDFVRGARQEVNLPADGAAGLPLSIDIPENLDVRSIELHLSYETAFLNITEVTAGASMPEGATVALDTLLSPGVAVVRLVSPVALPSGRNTLVSLRTNVASVSERPIYRRNHVMAIHTVTITGSDGQQLPVVADAGVYTFGYFADVSGNGRINAGDAALLARVAALLDEGFMANPLTDPVILGDISGNGIINAADASLVARFAALFEVPEIPPIPSRLLAGYTGSDRRPGGPTLIATRFGRSVSRINLDRYLVQSASGDSAVNNRQSFGANTGDEEDTLELRDAVDKLFSDFDHDIIAVD